MLWSTKNCQKINFKIEALSVTVMCGKMPILSSIKLGSCFMHFSVAYIRLEANQQPSGGLMGVGVLLGRVILFLRPIGSGIERMKLMLPCKDDMD